MRGFHQPHRPTASESNKQMSKQIYVNAIVYIFEIGK